MVTPFQNAFEHFTIDPMTNWERCVNPQFFVNCNVDDAAVENHVLGQAGSYGKQLGKIIDVLDIVVAHLPETDLLPREKNAINEFRNLSRQVKDAVRAVNGPGNKDADAVEQLVDELDVLRQTDPDAYSLLVYRLQKVILAQSVR